MRLVLKILAVLAAVLVLLAGSLAAVLAFRPEALLNDRTLTIGKRYLPKLGIDASWQVGHLSVESLSRLDKRITLSLEQARIATETAVVDLATARATVTVSLRLRGRLLTGIGPVAVDGAAITVTPAAEPPPPGKPVDWEAVLGFFEGRTFEPVAISVDRWQVASAGGGMRGTAKASVARDQNGAWRVVGRATGEDAAPFRELELDATVGRRPDRTLLQALVVDGRMAARLPDARSARATLGIRPDDAPGAYLYDVDAAFDQPGLTARLLGSGAFDRRRITGDVEARLREVAGKRVNLVLAPCRASAQSQDFLKSDATLRLACEGSVDRPPLDIPSDLATLLPGRLRFGIDASVDLVVGRNDRIVDARVDLDVRETTVATIAARGKAHVTTRFAVSSPAAPESAKATFALSLAIDHFEHLVARMRRTQFAVPAPLNQLGGPASCGLEGTVDLVRQGLTLPVVCRTDLSSSSQALATDARLELGVKKVAGGRLQPKLEGEVLLQSVRVVLPDINPARALPRLFPDPRIGEKTAGAPARTLPLKYRVVIKTAESDSLKIANSLTGDPIPVALDLVAADDRGTSGTVTLGRFDLELFRRMARVQNIRLTFAPGREAADLSGLVAVDNNDYKITVTLMGTTRQPRWRIITDPPLPESDAVAVLLFGRPPEELDEDARRSSEDARAAIANDAISLLSMYYLAATPIESIGYNPHTGVFTAKVKLREGLSLTLGSGAEDTGSVGLRKRIGRNWSVETTAMSVPGEDRNKGVAMLRWAKRY